MGINGNIYSLENVDNLINRYNQRYGSRYPEEVGYFRRDVDSVTHAPVIIRLDSDRQQTDIFNIEDGIKEIRRQSEKAERLLQVETSAREMQIVWMDTSYLSDLEKSKGGIGSPILTQSVDFVSTKDFNTRIRAVEPAGRHEKGVAHIYMVGPGGSPIGIVKNVSMTERGSIMQALSSLNSLLREYEGISIVEQLRDAEMEQRDLEKSENEKPFNIEDAWNEINDSISLDGNNGTRLDDDDEAR